MRDWQQFRHIVPILNTIRHRLLPCSLAAVLLLPGAVRADWSVSGVAEVAAAAQRSRLGLALSPSGEEGLAHRFELGWQSYSASTGSAEAEVAGPEAEYSLGYRQRRESGWWGGYLGLQYRQLRVSPKQAGDDLGEDGWRVGVHFDGEFRLTEQWRVGGRFDSYPQTKGYSLRGRLLHELGDGFAVGPEMLLEADEDHDTRQLGLVLQFPERAGFRITTSAGVQRGDDGDLGGYIGFEFSRDF